jgi:hypothetical protein
MSCGKHYDNLSIQQIAQTHRPDPEFSRIHAGMLRDMFWDDDHRTVRVACVSVGLLQCISPTCELGLESKDIVVLIQRYDVGFSPSVVKFSCQLKPARFLDRLQYAAKLIL